MNYYRANPGLMVAYIQKRFAIKDGRLAERMYEEDAANRTENGEIDDTAMAEILETAKETMKVKTSIPANQLFDFSLVKETK